MNSKTYPFATAGTIIFWQHLLQPQDEINDLIMCRRKS